jgi:site-specific DNA-methyltransferase (adenine-specific)
MGRDWDDFEPKEFQEWCERWAGKVKRVLKPGGHLLAFGGNRTHHRAFCGIEDAGLTLRDTCVWHYGSGFPKALDVSKAIDKAAGAEREVVGENPHYSENRAHDGFTKSDTYVATGSEKQRHTTKKNQTAPATDAAERWSGWKTALKPASEFIALARKPFDGTVADNVQRHGTAALNIDGTRIGTDVDTARANSGKIGDGNKHSKAPNPDMTVGSETGGRYPANVIFDEAAANESDAPTRYFYTSKATRAERTLDGRIDNAHPTVKPSDLMEWLVRLVTREGQIVLDPFAGTGTTCKAAKELGRRFVGIEQQAQWADVARARVGLTPRDPAHVREDDNQHGLGDF